MIVLSNGHSYKLIYIDTNIINEIAKNTNYVGKNFLDKFALGGFAFVTSVYNLYELFKTQGQSRNTIIKFFDNFPLLINMNYPQLIEYEKSTETSIQDMILFSMGPKPLFNNQISTILSFINNDKSFNISVQKMQNNLNRELHLWKKEQQLKNWMLNFQSEMLISMNETFKYAPNNFKIIELGRFKSLELFSFIRNQFIYTTNKTIDTNSIIDAYNASFLPYTDIYITERTVGSWLENIAIKRFQYLKNIEIIKLSALYN